MITVYVYVLAIERNHEGFSVTGISAMDKGAIGHSPPLGSSHVLTRVTHTRKHLPAALVSVPFELE